MQDDRLRHLHRGRQQIIGESPGEKIALGRVDVFLVQGRAERLRKAAVDLARHHGRMQDAAAIVHGDIAVDVRGAGSRIDLDAAEIEDEAVAQRAVDLVGFVRRGEFGWRPEYRLPDRLIEFGGDRAWRPMPGRGDAREGNGVVRICARGDAAVGEDDLRGRYVELRGGEPRQPVAQAHGGNLGGAGDRGREAAGIIPRGDRPGVLGGIHVGDDADVLRLQAKRVGDDLCQHGAMALALRDRGDLHRDGAERIEAIVAVDCAPFFGPARRRSSAVRTPR